MAIGLSDRTMLGNMTSTAMIFGAQTKNVLYVGVRNKYCAVGAKAEQLSRKPNKHQCYKNWGRDQSSTAMEADIICKGFKQSVEMRSLIYKTPIADGDTSTFQSIRDANPYTEHQVTVNKIECDNHLFRNLCKKIREAAKSKMTSHRDKNVIGKGKFQAYMERSALRMRNLITEIRYFRKNDIISKADNAVLLQKDIFIVLNHVFGDHSGCTALPIKCKPDENEINLMPQLYTTGCYSAVFEAVRYLSCHADSLLENVTNNLAESGNFIVNKLNSAKRINHCARNSFQMRCYGGVVQRNTQELISRVQLCADIEVPPSVIRMENRRQLHVIENRLVKGSRRKKWHGVDQDYGPSARKPDMSEDAYNVCVQSHFDKLTEHQNNRHQIEQDTASQSKYELWHQLRTEIITASKFVSICRMLESTSCSKMVASIRYPKVLDTAAIHFTACGLFIDSRIAHLGASPDGLIDEDGVVEIKCPISTRNIAPEIAIQQIPHLRSIFEKKNTERMNQNHIYYYQFQGQLHKGKERRYCIFAL